MSQVLIYFMVQGPWLQVKTQSPSWASLICFPERPPSLRHVVCAWGVEREEEGQGGKREVGPTFPAKSWAPLGPFSCWPQGSQSRIMRAVFLFNPGPLTKQPPQDPSWQGPHQQGPQQLWALMVSNRMARGRKKSRWEASKVWGASTSSSGGAISLPQALLEAGQAMS